MWLNANLTRFDNLKVFLRCRDGVPYCEADYHAQFGVKCEGCSRYISGRVLEVRYQHEMQPTKTKLLKTCTDLQPSKLEDNCDREHSLAFHCFAEL